MSKCGKGCMPECEYFTTGGCISPFNCIYKEESGYINSATSGTVIYTGRMNMTNEEMIENLKCVIADISEQCELLKAENAELKARLENAVDLPCKVGDNIYVRYYNNKEKRHCVEVERVSKTNFNITNGILSGTVYTYDFSKRHEEDNCYNVRDYNKKWFTDRVAAEARLEELKGEK